jgi:hypothetical protein
LGPEAGRAEASGFEMIAMVGRGFEGRGFGLMNSSRSFEGIAFALFHGATDAKSNQSQTCNGGFILTFTSCIAPRLRRSTAPASRWFCYLWNNFIPREWGRTWINRYCHCLVLTEKVIEKLLLSSQGKTAGFDGDAVSSLELY